MDYSLQQQQREQPLSDNLQKKKMEETINKLKQMKIIPLKTHSHFVSIEEFEKNTILFPWEKSKKYNKDLKLILEDVPVIDEQFLNLIEEQHPRRLDSIRKLLQKLGKRIELIVYYSLFEISGIKETPNIRDIYQQQIFPTMADPSRWSTKSSELLITYLICFYHYYELEKIGFTQNDLNQFQKTAVIRTRQNQFLPLSSPDTVIHSTSIYGCERSLESLKYPFHFISNDYYTQYRTEFFQNKRDIYRFREFLEAISVCEFLQINVVTSRKLIIRHNNSSILLFD